MAADPGLIAGRLLRWYQRNRRDFPWRRTRDPYRIWISEVMLQQTRAEAVLPYYHRFLERFPTVEALARAPEADVLACWSGLGYYSRARNLLRAARRIAAAGRFPRDYDSLRALPGIGDYTAAAIASIAFDLPHAVLDGNVLRVLARLENDPSDIRAAGTRRRFRELAQQYLDARNPGSFNQALMELGATICLPKTPRCGECPLARGCEARRRGVAAELPVKARKAETVAVNAALAIVERNGRILLRRGAHGFWELPSPEQAPELQELRALGEFRHAITRYRYRVRVVRASVSRVPSGFRWLTRRELPVLPLSTLARKALRVAHGCAQDVIIL